MKKLWLRLRCCLSVAFILAAGQSAAVAEPVHVNDVADLQVLFTPGDSGYAAITELLSKAKKQVRVSAYHFRSPAVAKALIKAKKRGVDVQIIMDKKNLSSKHNQAPVVAKAGIAVWIDEAHEITHNKYMVVDSQWVETGSFNYRDNAEYNNSENMLVIESRQLAHEYEKNWNKHRQHSVRFESK